jgi:hypothetical protein
MVPHRRWGLAYRIRKDPTIKVEDLCRQLMEHVRGLLGYIPHGTISGDRRWSFELLKNHAKSMATPGNSAESLEACSAIDMVVAGRVYQLMKLGREVPDDPAPFSLKRPNRRRCSDSSTKLVSCWISNPPWGLPSL